MATQISSILSKEQMLAVVDTNMPDQFFAICKDDGFIYKYEKTNTSDVETGKFKKFTSGGSDIINLAGIIMGNYADHETIIYDNRELNDLTDVTVSTPSNGQVLKYDATNNIWINGSAPGGGSGGASDLNDLNDVTISSATNGQVLKFNGSAWVNAAESGGGSSTFLTQTLTAGSTTVTFTNLPTTGDYYVDFYTSTGINYNSIDTATAGQCTLTFTAQATNVVVYCEIKEITV